MPDWRALVERLLPWYTPTLERARDARTAVVVRRSEAARQRAERIIHEYQSAEQAASRAGDRLVDEARK